MRWRRLGWAGVELEAQGETIVIDHLLDPGVFSPFLSDERDALIEPDPARASAALVTHLHRDHTDVGAIESALAEGGPLLRPPRASFLGELQLSLIGEAEEALASSSLATRECSIDDSLEIGPFTVTALPASDGLGSPQVSWLVEAGGARVLHAGDTIWHGAWWDMAAEHGPIDVAFLPANGAVIDFPQRRPAVDALAVMSPEQCVDAAHALDAKLLCPIHFNRMFEHPKYYRPTEGAAERVARSAAERDMDTSFPEPGDWQALVA